jgi:NAD(P)-dependent dehydrogenase (short-subunit alcohol dehydrogenase family)
MNQLDLQGKRAIVTGAAAGLGLAIAKRLAASGARIQLWDRNEVALARAIEEIGSAASAVAVDIAEPAGIAAGLEEALKHMGGIDVLVNNAGISGPNAATSDYPIAEWKRVIDINLTGTFLCCQAVIPHMLAQDYGRIVNVASVAGKEGNPNAPAYSASKAGVIALTKTLGKELARSGVRVNCITPAAVRTAIFDQMSDDHVEFMLSKIPMGRFGTVEEIAGLVTWLCTEECSFSTGAVFDLSGGRATY